MTPETASPLALPAPPRPVTGRVRFRAWVDPHVRFWWLSGAGLVVVGVWILLANYLEWHRGERLIRAGTVVQATVAEAAGVSFAGKQMPPDSRVRLQFNFNGQPREVSGYLEGRKQSDFILIGSTVPIRIDPNHPDVWTARTEPTPLPLELIGGSIALPAGLLLLVVSFALARSRLATWTEGAPVAALVVSSRHTALAPRSWAAQCTPADEADKRVFGVYLPPTADVSPGAPAWLLFRHNSAEPLAAEWFTGKD